MRHYKNFLNIFGVCKEARADKVDKKFGLELLERVTAEFGLLYQEFEA